MTAFTDACLQRNTYKDSLILTYISTIEKKNKVLKITTSNFEDCDIIKETFRRRYEEAQGNVVKARRFRSVLIGIVILQFGYYHFTK